MTHLPLRHVSRPARRVLAGVALALVAAAAPMLVAGETPETPASAHPRGKADAALPKPRVDLKPGRVALVVTDPQNDFLSPDGVAWGVIGENVMANGTVEHLDQLFATAHASDVPVFISPHYYYPHDHGWRFEGALEQLMHDIHMFDRTGPLDVTDFEGSGADWLEQYKPYINHPNTTVTSPHKVYGPSSNDLVLQLRKAQVDQVILAGMSSNLCTESHMRELLEAGFEVIVVPDATAAAVIPGYDGFEAAYINFRFMANGVWSTDEAVARMAKLKDATSPAVSYRTMPIDGVDVFYRETGPTDAPHVLLLHGFPTSSRMFSDLIPKLAERYHVVAPDYPGFGSSAMPGVDAFDYSFDNIAQVVDKLTEALGMDRFSVYVADYGAPVGFRIATAHPDRIEAIVVQNGTAHEDGLLDFWEPLRAYWNDPSEENESHLRHFLTLDATRWQYTHGTRNPESINPDNWLLDQSLLDRPGNDAIQLALFYDYRTNLSRYPQWQAYLRDYQPPTLIVWGANDVIFPAAGARAYLRDLPEAELHLLDTGHFALEEDGETIAELMLRFLDEHTAQ